MDETSKTPPSSDDGPDMSGYRQAPSRNQKKRSKLSQTTEEIASTEPEPPPPPAATPASPPPPARKHRLKRSGHMHDDLSAPIPEGPPAKESEY